MKIKLDRVTVPKKATSFTREEYVAHLEHLGYRRVGQGAYSSVFRHPSREHVVKVGWARHNRSYLDFVSYALAIQENPWMPEIYSAGIYTQGRKTTPNEESYVVIALETLAPMNSKQFNKISQPMEAPQEYMNLSKNRLISFIDPAFEQVLGVLNSLSNQGHYLDLHSGNVMLRGKQPVVTDPVVD